MLRKLACCTIGLALLSACEGFYIGSDAALFDPPPKRRKPKRGRPRKKGKRLPVPAKLAPADPNQWTLKTFDVRGHQRARLLWSRPVLWFRV